MDISIQHYPAGLEQPRHGHGDAGFSIVLAGSLLERVGRTEEVAGPLSVVCKPIDTEHANRFGPDGATLLRVSVSPAVALELTGWAASLRSWRWTHGGNAARAFLRLALVWRSAAGSPGMLEGVVWEAIGALAQESSSRPRGACLDPPRWLALIREAIEDSARAPRVDALARQAHVHPVYLARQFRRYYGCSISEHVQRTRIRRSVGLITRESSLSRVSLAVGFTDQSHMCRVFRRETGMTPRQYRHLVAGTAQRLPTRRSARQLWRDGDVAAD